MSASDKPTEKLFKSFLAAVLAISLCPLMPAEKAQAEEVGGSAEQADAPQMSDEGLGGDANPAEGALAAGNSDADPELAGVDDGAEDEGVPDDGNVALQAASDSGTPIVNWTKCGTCQWMIDSNGCLIIEPQSGETGELNGWSWEAPWGNYKNSIISAAIKKTVIAKTTQKAFYGCESLRSIDLSGLDTSSVADMSYMFDGCSSLSSLDLSSLDTSKVTAMYGMFRGCSSLSSLDLSSFDTSKVTIMSAMFSGCSSFSSLDLSSFDTSSVVSMCSEYDYSYQEGMFYGCSSLSSLDLSSFDTSKVTAMTAMFSGCSSLSSLDLSSFDTSSATSMSFMFDGCSSLRAVALGEKFSFDGAKDSRQCSLPKPSGDGLTGRWVSSADGVAYPAGEVPSNVSAAYTAQREGDGAWIGFGKCMWRVDASGCLTVRPLPGLEEGALGTWSSTPPWYGLRDSIESARFEGRVCAGTARNMFEGCSKLASLDLSSLDTSQVTDMRCMFDDCSSLTSLDLSSLDTSKVTGMSDMFLGCSSLTSLDLSGLDTSSVADMCGMFRGCSSLSSLDLSSFDTSKVTAMGSMFYGCSSLSSLDLSSFDTSKVESMYAMFYGCSRLASLDLSSFDTSSATIMSGMFDGCSSLRAVALGEKFSFDGAKDSRQCSLPEPSGDGLSGLWKDLTTGKTYRCDAIPNNVAATYFAGRTARVYLQKSMFNVDTEDARYTGSPIEKSISSSLTNRADYAVKYENNMEVGTATIKITGVGDCSGELIYQFTILKAIPEYETPGTIAASYGQALNELALPKGFAWQDPSKVIEAVGDSVFLASFTPEDTDHYECVRDIPVTVKVPWTEVKEPVIDDFIYTGSLLKPDVPESSQYRVVSNGGGTNVGTYAVELALADPILCRWSDGTAENRIIKYAILPMSIEEAMLDPIPPTVLFEGSATPEPTVSVNGIALAKDKDYTLSYENNEALGTGTVVATGKGNYAGEVRAQFQICQYPIEGVDITNPGDYHVGNGQEQSKDVPYTSYSNYGLAESLYTADEINEAGGAAGTIANIAYKVAQAGTLETSSVKIYFGLTSANSLDKFVDPDSLTLVYEGSPTLGKREGWEQLKLTVPFEYDGSSNLVVAVSKSAGGYSETLRYESTAMTGMVVARQSGSSASYADIKSVVAGSDPGVRPNVRFATHSMLPEVTVEAPVQQTYTGGPLCPEPIVRYGDHVLACGEDYDVSYVDNINVGRATVTVVGKGEFSGERSVDFEIAPFDISSIVVDESRIVDVSEGMASDSRVPFATRDYYSLSEQLYTADEIRENGGAAGAITGIAFHVSKNGSLKGGEQTYYIGSTSKSKLDQGSYITGLQSVKGRMTGHDADGWQTIAFDEPYQWDGESNMVVAVYVACPPSSGVAGSTLEYYGTYVEGMSGYSTSRDRKTAEQLFNSSPSLCGVRPDIRFSIEDLAVSIGNINIQYATGEAVQPQVSVSLGDRVLENGRDYTVSYEDNVNPGTGYAIVEGTGNFTGSRRTPFVIASASFAEDGKLDVSVGDTSAKTTQSPYASNEASSDGSTHLGVAQALYKASEIAAAGGARGIIDGISYYSLGGTSFSPKKVKVYIEPTEMNALWYVSSEYSNSYTQKKDFFPYENATLVYEGTPTLGRDEGWEQLDLSTPFEYDGESNILVTVVTDSGEKGAKGSYSADKVKGMFLSGCEGEGSNSAIGGQTRPSIKFTMRANLSYATGFDIATQPYRGVPVTPKPLLKFGERTLEEGVDYELSYENNDAIGTGTVIVTGIGNYSGEKRVQFAIGSDIAAATSLPLADEVYCGKAIEPKPVLSFGGRTLEEGVDYELSYERNVNAGVGIAVATGIGSQFAGEKRIEFHIEQADIANESVQAISAQDYTGMPLEPLLYVGNLEPRVDYDLSYENNVEIGTATVTATGKGNYEGVRKSTFRIVKADIHDDHTVILNDQNSGGYNLEDGETAVWGFSLTSDSLVSIITSQTSLLSAGNALHLVLRDDDGKIAFEWSEPASPNVNSRGLMFLHKGRWHLSVTALGKQSYGSDRPVIVSVTGGSAPGGVEREYNDSFESATTIGTNSPLMWGALFNPASDVSGRYMDDDYWTFTLKRPAKTKVALSSTADAARACDFSLSDETGAPVEKDGLPLEGTSKGKRLQTVLDCGELPAGKYYVKVSLGNASCWNSQYAIKVNADSSISLDDCSIVVDQGSVFNGSEQKPLVVMKNASGVLLIEGQDYSVEYRDNVNAGYGTVVVKGMGAYFGERSETFEISPAGITTDMISGVPAQMKATGEQLRPDPIVSFEGKALIEGEDYTVSYGENVETGWGSVTVASVDGGNFSGSATVYFDIREGVDESGGAPIVEWTPSGTCWWMIDSAGCLTVKPQPGAFTGRLDGWEDSGAPWANQASSIVSAVIEDGVVAPQSLQGMFASCANLVSLDLTGLSISETADMSHMFEGCTSLTDVSLSCESLPETVSLESCFKGCASLSSVTLNGFENRFVKLASIFDGCSSLRAVDLSAFDGAKALSIEGMFRNCGSIESVDMSSISASDITYNELFSGCSSLKSVDISGLCNTDRTDVYNWAVGGEGSPGHGAEPGPELRKLHMVDMFNGCDSIETITVGEGFSPSQSWVIYQWSAYGDHYFVDSDYCFGNRYFDGAYDDYAFPDSVSGHEVEWKNADTGKSYSSKSIPNGVAATYTVQVEGGGAVDPEPQQFAVIYHLDGGANATDNPATYTAGTAVPLADPTKEGFEFQGWYADAEFTVRVTEIPADASGDVELWAKWKEQKPAPVFTDVDYSSWYGDAVSYVASKGLITGYTDGVRAGQFGVGDVLTRAQLATILWRNACPDEYASYDPETAVDTTGIDGSADGMYYTAAANWAVKNGVITGFDREDGTKDFAADDDVSFEQLITILSRLCATDAELSAAGSDLSAFADGDLASSWSRGAFAWAAANGLVQGYDEPTGKYLRPGDPVARERVAVVLMRAFEMGIMK